MVQRMFHHTKIGILNFVPQMGTFVGILIKMKCFWSTFLLVCGLAFSADRQQLMRIAEEYMRTGEEQKALVTLQQIRALDTSAAGIDKRILDLQVKLGMWVSSDPYVQSTWVAVDPVRLDQVKPAGYDSLFQLARQLVEKEQYPESMRILAFLKDKAPTHKQYGPYYQEQRLRLASLSSRHLTIAESLLVQRSWDLALMELHRAAFYAPEDARMQERIQTVQNARDASLTALKSDLALHQGKGDFTSARQTCAKGILEFPEENVFRLTLDSLQNQDNAGVEKLRDDLQKARTKGDWATLERLLVTAKAEMPSDPEVKALQAELVTQQMNKVKFDRWMEDARTALRNRQFANAESSLQSALELQPNSQLATKLLAEVQNAQKTAQAEEEKIKELQKLSTQVKTGQVQSDKVGDLKLTGSAKVDQEVKQVQREVRKAEFARTPENDRKAQEYFLAGIARYRAGEYQEALRLWKQVLELNPSHEQAAKYIANVQQKLSRLK